MPPTSVLYNKAIQPECPYVETDAIFPSGGRKGGRRWERQPYYAKDGNKGCFHHSKEAL